MKKWILWLNLFLLPFTFSLQAEEIETPVVILGSGVGALTSAVYLARSGITPVVITGAVLGGTITQSHQVQNWPGEIAISGADLGEKVRKQAEVNGAILEPEEVVSVDFSKHPYIITTKSVIDPTVFKKYKTHSVIIALGATPNLLNVPGESGSNGYWSAGVYSCAVCDGGLYKDKVVTIVGGGDSALIEAQYLSRLASKVNIVVRKNSFRTVEKQRLDEVLSTPNIQIYYETIIKEIKGDQKKLTHLIVEDTALHQQKVLETDALFLAIGSTPNTRMFSDQLELDSSGYIVLKKHQETSLQGVYAIGDVSDPEFKQAVSAAGDAAKAALQAQKFLTAHLSAVQKTVSQVKPEIPSLKKEVIEILSKEHFNTELRDAKSIVFVDFYSTYCGPCKMFGPIYESWAQNYGDKVKFLKINADTLPQIFEEYQIHSVPTLMVFDEKGKILRRGSGLSQTAEVEKSLKTMSFQ